jgi:hypothetical protein
MSLHEPDVQIAREADRKRDYCVAAQGFGRIHLSDEQIAIIDSEHAKERGRKTK